MGVRWSRFSVGASRVEGGRVSEKCTFRFGVHYHKDCMKLVTFWGDPK